MAYSPIAAASSLIIFILLLSTLLGLANALATAAAASPMRSYVVTGANKGQGYALCKRILSEHDDTHGQCSGFLYIYYHCIIAL